jgi:hypothetical protein
MKAEKTISKKAQQPCRHFWIIEPPGAETSLGVCKHCGERRKFMNSYRYSSIGSTFKKQVPEEDKLISS